MIEFPAAYEDDIILLKQFDGLDTILKGRFMRDKDTTVWVVRNETDMDELKVVKLVIDFSK